MAEKYFEYAFFFDYQLPFMILAILGVMALALFAVALAIDKLDERRKRKEEEHFGKEDKK